jgi:hypothetical protein
MAQVVAPGSQTTKNAPHGKKRAADSSLEHEQRLSKRFDLLNLGMCSLLLLPMRRLRYHTQASHANILIENNGTRFYIPVPGSTDATLPRPATTYSGADPLAFIPSRNPRHRKPRPTPNDGMDVEDTPHRVYIADLAAELSDVESDEENPIFLSDIEKHLSRIPKHVLLGPEPKPTEHNQVVLYNVPASLSVPEAQDNVRKAIVEARQRIRERQVSPVTEIEVERSDGRRMRNEIPLVEEDGDAMDID